MFLQKQLNTTLVLLSQHNLWYETTLLQKKNKLTSSVYDCTVEDVEYIYNKLSI